MEKLKSPNNRIAIFLPDVQGGGAQRVMLDLASCFVAHGFYVDLILAKTEGELLDEIPVDVNLVELNVSRMSLSLFGLIKYLRMQKPISMISTLGLPNFFAVLGKRLAGVQTKVVIRIANKISFRDKKTLKKWIEDKFITYSYLWADRIIAISHSVAEDMAINTSVSLDRITVIYNPVISPQMMTLLNDEVDHRFYMDNQNPVVLGVGRLTNQKDFPTLINAFKIVREQKQARLIILGKGEEYQNLVDLVNNLELYSDVDLPGFVKNPIAFMRRSAVFVMSSKWEGFGSVLVQAMACGCPVVSTACGPPEEILDQGKYGHLTPIGNPNRMAQSILDVLNGDLRLSDEEWLQQYNIDHIALQYISVLTD